MSAESARQRAREAAREADRAVGSDRRLRRAAQPFANDRAVPQRLTRLARSRMQPL
jgi:hypothetical protein